MFKYSGPKVRTMGEPKLNVRITCNQLPRKPLDLVFYGC